MKRKITKTAFEALSDELKKLYAVNPSDATSYELDLDDDDKDDAASLKKALAAERKRANDAEKKVKDDAEAAQAKLDDANKKAGNVEALEASWKKKLDDQKAEYEGKIAGKDGVIRNHLVDNVAIELSAKISKAPKLMQRVIKDRLTVEFDGDTPKTRVLGPDGKPSAMTIEELSNELVANPDYSDIVIASKGSGGTPNQPNPGGTQGFGGDKPTILSKLAPADLIATIRAKDPTMPKAG